MKKVKVSDRIIQEAQNIVDGVYAPLEGFVSQKDFESILVGMRLMGGEIWSMPVVWDVDDKTAKKIKQETEVALQDSSGKTRFVLKQPKVYKYKKDFLAKNLYGTLDPAHPGLVMIKGMADYLVSGRVTPTKEKSGIIGSYLSPVQTKKMFSDRGWQAIAAFQTRNAPHRSHEHLQVEALQYTDGVFINPIMGEKKPGDFHDDAILGSYKMLIDKHHPKDRFALATFHTFMRYAGPKEAIFHALARRNFGCTHMIIGRDHAGVGSYYGSYDAQRIFDNFTDEDLGIKILKFENAAYCKECKKITFDNECNHLDKIFLSGSELRRRFIEGEDIPDEFMRDDIVLYLRNNKGNIFV